AAGRSRGRTACAGRRRARWLERSWCLIVRPARSLRLKASAGGNSRPGRRSILRSYGGDENGSSQLVERFDGPVSGGFRRRRMGTEAREKRSRESGRLAKELESPAGRRRGRRRQRRAAQALGRRMEETTVARGLRRAAPRRYRAGRNEPARPRKAPGGVRLHRLQPPAFHLGDEI